MKENKTKEYTKEKTEKIWKYQMIKDRIDKKEKWYEKIKPKRYEWKKKDIDKEKEKK